MTLNLDTLQKLCDEAPKKIEITQFLNMVCIKSTSEEGVAAIGALLNAGISALPDLLEAMQRAKEMAEFYANGQPGALGYDGYTARAWLEQWSEK